LKFDISLWLRKLFMFGKKVFFTGICVCLIFIFSGCLKPQSTGILMMADNQQIQAVDASNWEEFSHQPYKYKFQYPSQEFFLIKTNEKNKLSNIIENEKVEAISIGVSDYYYMYFIPEGGFPLTDRDSSKAKETRNAIFAGKTVSIEKYDNENIYIRFKDLHDFRIQVFVSEDYEDIGWAKFEKVLETFEFID